MIKFEYSEDCLELYKEYGQLKTWNGKDCKLLGLRDTLDHNYELVALVNEGRWERLVSYDLKGKFLSDSSSVSDHSDYDLYIDTSVTLYVNAYLVNKKEVKLGELYKSIKEAKDESSKYIGGKYVDTIKLSLDIPSDKSDN